MSTHLEETWGTRVASSSKAGARKRKDYTENGAEHLAIRKEPTMPLDVFIQHIRNVSAIISQMDSLVGGIRKGFSNQVNSVKYDDTTKKKLNDLRKNADGGIKDLKYVFDHNDKVNDDWKRPESRLKKRTYMNELQSVISRQKMVLEAMLEIEKLNAQKSSLQQSNVPFTSQDDDTEDRDDLAMGNPQQRLVQQKNEEMSSMLVSSQKNILKVEHIVATETKEFVDVLEYDCQELNTMFRQFSTIINEQDTLIDMAHGFVSQANQDVGAGVESLQIAKQYQKQGRTTMLLVLGAVVVIGILLFVLMFFGIMAKGF